MCGRRECKNSHANDETHGMALYFERSFSMDFFCLYSWCNIVICEKKNRFVSRDTGGSETGFGKNFDRATIQTINSLF